MRAKIGMFDLPPHSTIADRSPVDVVSEREEHGRKHELLRAALDEHRRARKEELVPLRVELADDPEGRRRRRAAGAASPGSRQATVLHEDELLQAADVEERRRMRRVDDLVVGECKRAQEAVEVALGLGAKEELRLLDEQEDAGEAGLDHVLHGPQKASAGPAPEPLVRLPQHAREALEHLGGGRVPAVERPMSCPLLSEAGR